MKAVGRLVLVGLFYALASGAAAAQDKDAVKPLLSTLSPDGKDACFGRVYDQAHLKSHPGQKVSRIYFYYGRDPVSHPNEEPGDGMAEAGYNGFLATTVRGSKKPDWVAGWCGGEDGDIGCGMECDRHMASLKMEGKDSLLLSDLQPDVYLDAGAEDELGETEYDRQSLGSDDDNFRLARRPVAECTAEFAKVDPIDPALGEPLRVRLKPDQPFCYGRDYSASHLESHAEQVTQTIRVWRGSPEIAAYVKAGGADNWPNGAGINVSVTIRKATGKSVQSYSCDGEGDQWRCVAMASISDAGCDIAAKEIYLRRGAKGTMMLANPNSSLPIVDMCSPEAEGATLSDDKVFRLDAMPQAQCGP